MRILLLATGVVLLLVPGCITSSLNDRALHPSSVFEITPEDLDLSYEVLVVESDDALIHAWFLPAADPSGDTVVVCGGNTGNKEVLLPLALHLHAAGFHVVLPDHRGFGLSTGEPDLWSLVPHTGR